MNHYRPQTRHTANVRTRDDERQRLAHFLGFATDAIVVGMTGDVLTKRFPKLPAREVTAALAEAQARRAARG